MNRKKREDIKKKNKKNKKKNEQRIPFTGTMEVKLWNLNC